MASVDYVITAKHYARRDGADSVIGRIQKLAEQIRRRGTPVTLIEAVRGYEVLAEIEFGQWVAHCRCGGTEFVDPNEPIFYCFGCGNRENGHFLRPVSFPSAAVRTVIERLVLARPVDDSRGLDDLDRAYQARPLIVLEASGPNVTKALSRSWHPSESVADLEAQNKIIAVWQARQEGK